MGLLGLTLLDLLALLLAAQALALGPFGGALYRLLLPCKLCSFGILTAGTARRAHWWHRRGRGRRDRWRHLLMRVSQRRVALLVTHAQLLGVSSLLALQVGQLNLTALQRRQSGAAFAPRSILAAHHIETPRAGDPGLLGPGLDLTTLGSELRALVSRCRGGASPGWCRQDQQGHHATMNRWPPHVSEVSTSRRSRARYSDDCISCKRETVRGNSCASGPSVYSCSGGTAAEMISLTRRS
jgi:hypothetical protein